jgi:hypothetical protein
MLSPELGTKQRLLLSARKSPFADPIITSLPHVACLSTNTILADKVLSIAEFTSQH